MDPTQNDGITIRFAQTTDAESANRFHNLHYGTTRTVTQWLWEFDRSPAANGALPFVIAEFEGRIVGTQALILIDMIDQSGGFVTAKSEETLVDPSMRGRNLFARMYVPLLEYTQIGRAHV